MQYSLIIPVYNEEHFIGCNLDILLPIAKIKQIIVVNDGSTDGTSLVLSKYTAVKIIKNKHNLGKTASVLRALEAANYSNVILYDADLQNMKQEYVQEMMTEYEKGYDMVIMNKNGAPWIFKKGLKTLPAMSGTRVLKKSILQEIRSDHTNSWSLEPMINSFCLSHKLKIGFTDAPGVYDPRKYIKYNFLRGCLLDLKAGFEVISCFGVKRIPKSYLVMRKIYQLNQCSQNKKTKLRIG